MVKLELFVVDVEGGLHLDGFATALAFVEGIWRLSDSNPQRARATSGDTSCAQSRDFPGSNQANEA
jgi:hypothetical protein